VSGTLCECRYCTKVREEQKTASPETHVEGGPDCHWYKIKVTEELFRLMGAYVSDWGEPDFEGFYNPVLKMLDKDTPTVV
jgi:hypothetical protein